MRAFLRRTTGSALTVTACLAVGCASGPLQDNPALVTTSLSVDRNACVANPVLLLAGQSGPDAYGEVFGKVLDVLDDRFSIAYANRYDGRIETHPRVAPGIVQFWKPGSPDVAERALATVQAYRHRCQVQILPATAGGYLVGVVVYKELEDVPKPTRSTAGQAAFRSDPTVDRQYEVVDPSVDSTVWIPKGRDTAQEQSILCQLQAALKD